MKKSFLFIISFLIIITVQGQNSGFSAWISNAPAGEKYCRINPGGETVIPNGRLITPAGKCYTVAPHPFGLVLSPNGQTAITANSGTEPLSITIMKNITGNHPKIIQIPPAGTSDAGVIESVFMGLAVSPGNKTVYVSGGQTNSIYMFKLRSGKPKGIIKCAWKAGDTLNTKGYLGDMVMTKDGSTIYVVDQVNFKVKVVDLVSKKVVATVNTGRYPFGIALSPDERNIYVANVGMYEYQQVKGIDHDDLKRTALAFPAFPYLSDQARDGITTDSLTIPGLGEANGPESFSVWAIDVSDNRNPMVTAKIKTGILVGEVVENIPAVGGSSPNSIVATDKYVFVSNGNNDLISVIDAKTGTILKSIKLTLHKLTSTLRGIIPFGLAVSPDNKRLYVAEAGINAVGVIDIDKMELSGHIPAGWFPSKLKVSSDGKKLIIANAKGYGSGPNGGQAFDGEEKSSYIGNLMNGTVQVVDIPDDKQLSTLTQKVIKNNYNFIQVDDTSLAWRKNNPVPLYPGQKSSPVKHIVFISKENRTYDEIFGQIPGGEGDPALARYGLGQSFTNRDKTDSVTDADVMVNHIALAHSFAIGDNFYVDSDVSADGHRWLSNTYPNEWVETSVPASYGGNRSYYQVRGTRGALSFNGASGAIYPEDYNEAGSMWDHLERNNIRFYNFGFAIMFDPASYDKSYTDIGMRYLYNFPLISPLYSNTSRTYPTFNMGIPDIFRVERFIEEFDKKWVSGKEEMPSLITVIIPNDHGAGERPADGYPFRESYMCDNDLAVGRIVEYLSHTPYWKNMMIVITEDDAQNGVDHIDAHRSILMVISPYVKRDYVSHVHYSFGSIFKTFWHILGIPYLNQYDATANDLSGLFTDEPDFTPYNAIPVDKRIFDPEKALGPFDKDFNWKAVEESPEIDNVDDMLRESKEYDKDRLENRKRK